METVFKETKEDLEAEKMAKDLEQENIKVNFYWSKNQ